MTLSREFWMSVRHALLILVGAIEKALDIEPSTKDCRELAKRSRLLDE